MEFPYEAPICHEECPLTPLQRFLVAQEFKLEGESALSLELNEFRLSFQQKVLFSHSKVIPIKKLKLKLATRLNS